MATKIPDLNTMSVEDLVQLIRDAEAALAGKRDGAKAELVEEMRTKAEALGLSLDDLLTRPGPRTNVRKPRSDAGKPMAAKYRGPNGETWTGRGRKPLWLVALEAEGKNREDYAA